MVLFEIISTVIKLTEKSYRIYKSYRDKRNEVAYSLNDYNLDYGNFLVIMILLNKFNTICEHFNII